MWETSRGSSFASAPCRVKREKTDSEQLIQAPALNYPLEKGLVSTANKGSLAR